MLSCQKGPIRHAYAWQIGPFGQDTLDISAQRYGNRLQGYCKNKQKYRQLLECRSYFNGYHVTTGFHCMVPAVTRGPFY